MLQWREWFHPSESMTPAVSYRTLQEAILQKDLDGLQRLLDAGRSPDGLSDLRETPLELSLRLGEEGFAERLLHHGANPNLGSRATETLPLQQAIQAGQPTLVRLLLAHGATVQTRIPHALRMPMNHLDDTLLHVAAQGGRLDIVTLLVDAGARMDATNRAGLTPMEHAIAGDHVEVTAFFLNAGADLEHRGRIGTTPLHLAALEGSVQTVGLLLQRGARVNTRTRNGSTPLHAAVARGHADIARLLVAHGADVHAAGQRGESPLDIAHRMGNAELLAILQPATTPTTPMVPTTPVVPTTEHVL
jgi:ankyrin repeat protein